MTKQQILDIVQKLLTTHPRPNPFTNNRPEKQWWSAFLRRNSDISMRFPENLCKTRAVSCWKEAILKWFREYKSYITDIEKCPEILQDPSRIFNADEAGFPLNPKSDKVLAATRSKDVYTISGSDKTSITILACANASGHLLPPMHVFPGERSFNPLHDAVPNSILGRTKSGWMDTEVFFMWLANHFVTAIPDLARPVVLLVDSHSTHIDLQTTRFCRENKIILYCLPAYASHIIQPLDVSFFGPLKLNWRKACKSYKDNNPGLTITKMFFAKVFHEAWVAYNKAETMMNGFRQSGLYLFNPFIIDEGKFSPSLLFVEPPNNVATDEAWNVADAPGLEAVPATITSAVPVTITSAVPATINSAVPATITSAVPATINSAVPTTITSAVPATINSAVPATINSAITATINSAVPATFTSPVPAALPLSVTLPVTGTATDPVRCIRMCSGDVGRGGS
ncbi:uncharacterized protein LOC110445301 [Mizuhopecten yessoensis]|uniref:uncharacterized protein LOC110445301 n=1 Tax=Mizuhopecten yessoensis TaxID=6573 RepID=UPI000B45F25E|nr:uncharacterized protein LOC110445301 [Mizuhopecten yessoensis]